MSYTFSSGVATSETAMGTLLLLYTVTRLSLGKLLVNLWQVVKRTNTPLIPWQNCLVDALPYSHYVVRSFPLCGVRILHPAQHNLTR